MTQGGSDVTALGYVVIQYNQASGRADISGWCPGIYDQKLDALSGADDLLIELGQNHRRDQVAVARVELVTQPSLPPDSTKETAE